MMENENLHEISPETLQSWLEVGEPVEVIDIRPRKAFEDWRIPGSRNVDAYYDISKDKPGHLADYKPLTNTPIVVVCFAGITSLIAVRYMRSRNIPAYSLMGGMEGWSQAWNSAFVPLEAGRVRVIQVRRIGKGCLSYMVGSEGEALVIDPSLDAQVYLDLAIEYGWRILNVVDTHIHADHLSRGRVLAELAGAEYYLPDQKRTHFAHATLMGSDMLYVGEVGLTTVSTPGHTAESISLSLENQALFTGDTLFLESVGRPDLNANVAETAVRAQALHHSLQGLRDLDPQMLVLPSHTSRPVTFDREPLSAMLGDVLKTVGMIQMPEEAFVCWVQTRAVSPPANYQKIVGLNEAGKMPEGNPAQLEVGGNRCAI